MTIALIVSLVLGLGGAGTTLIAAAIIGPRQGATSLPYRRAAIIGLILFAVGILGVIATALAALIAAIT